MTFLSRLLSLPSFLCLVNCSTDSSSTEVLPKITNPARAKAWGPPSTKRFPEGYQLSYTNPDNGREHLRIIASTKPTPYLLYPPNVTGTRMVNGVPTSVNEPQTWNKSLALGVPIKWYQKTLEGPDSSPLFRSLGQKLKSPEGNSGYFRFEVEGTKNQMQMWLSELRFATE